MKNKKRILWSFALSFVLILAVLILSVVKTNAYNRVRHHETIEGPSLFTTEEAENLVSVSASARGSTWTKVFDFDNVGLEDPNFQAYTYDFTVYNNTGDAVSDFIFTLTFRQEVYLSSAWNGALEIHQKVDGGELVSSVPDLRDFTPSGDAPRTVTVDGDTLIAMMPGDYLIYTPSSSMNALEIPIEPHEGTTPGLILYVAIDESVEDSALDLEYSFHRVIYNEPLFWISMLGFAIWAVVLIISVITWYQIRKYALRHEQDNKIINESIETFISFIDAKDPYTNGHSKRVAQYTRAIASEMGYEGEELDRIYYVALLHDCGKIGVPDNILGKPGKLTDEEFQIIKSHTVRGGEILSHFKSLENVGEGARYHHERYDGRGYPEGLAGEDIPLIARMICVADSFDAMNTNRVYRNKLTTEHIMNEIEANKGRQFDPAIADVMLRLLRENRLPLEG